MYGICTVKLKLKQTNRNLLKVFFKDLHYKPLILIAALKETQLFE